MRVVGTLLVLLPVSTMVLTGKEEGGSPPKKCLPVSTTVLTGKDEGGSPPKKCLPVSTTVLTGKPEGGWVPKRGGSLRGKKTVSTHGVYYVSYAPPWVIR